MEPLPHNIKTYYLTLAVRGTRVDGLEDADFGTLTRW